jgi:Peptidase MA superfamily
MERSQLMPLRYYGRVLIFACCLLGLFLLPVAMPRHALALHSSSTITITSQSTSLNFPNSITFNVSARDTSSAIVSAEIVVDLQSFNGPETHVIPLRAPQRNVQLRWKEDTSGSNFVTPGTTIDYFWRFADSAGTVYFEPQQELTTSDTRFAWQHLTRGLLRVNWYDRNQNFGQSMLSQASASIKSISANLGGGLQDPINLWVYETDSDFHGSLTPGSFEWVGGIAFPMLHEASIVVASTDDYTLMRDMPHELTHLVFHQLIDNGLFVPTWFDEGLAVSNQQFHEQEMTARFDQALANHALLRLQDITNGFPANSDQAYLAYAQSWNLVQYMYNTFGTARMIQFIKQLGAPSADFEQAMQHTLGVDILHLENQWRLHLNQPGILTPGQLTPTPQVTAHPTAQASGTGGASSDNRSWVLIVLGGALVAGSVIGLLALFVVMRRPRRKPTPASPASGAWPAGNGAPRPYADPAIYTQESMYMRPAGPSPRAQQPPLPEAPPVAPGQEYSSYRPPPQRSHYPQAPQE